MKNMLALSQERFSARKFTSEAVSQEDVDYIMECVRLAPSAVNRQPWHWLIVRSDEAKEKLQECYDREWFKTAPMYIVGMKNVNENWVRRYDEKPHGDIDVAIAAEHLCLAATERGLGTCWVCNYDTDKMQQFFPREGFEAVVIIALYDTLRIVGDFNRLSLVESLGIDGTESLASAITRTYYVDYINFPATIFASASVLGSRESIVAIVT